MTAHRSLLGLLAVCGALVTVERALGFCIQDDAYISFRYARNLARGDGLVYNVGERVEGYTNFLWTVLFTPVEVVGVDPGPVAVSLGMIASIALLHATWRLGQRRVLAPLVVAAFPGLAMESVQGLETAFYAWLVTEALCGQRRWPIFAGLAALTRPEGYAIFGVLWLLRRGWTDLRVTATFLAITVPHLLLRVFYYGDIVPNTFHAKVGDPGALAGAAWQRGVGYLVDCSLDMLPAMIAFGVALVLFATRRAALPAGRGREALALVALMVVYIVAVGGDFKETGRFLIPVLPAIAVLAQAATAGRHRLLPWALGAAVVIASVPGFWEMKGHADRFAALYIDRARAGEHLRDTTPPGTLIAIHSAGIVPYYADRPTIDMWGLNDRHIARAPIDAPGTGTAGHERHDYAYVLSRRPQLILPEQGLVTGEPVMMPAPGVFPSTFAELYRSGSSALPGGGYLNVWLLQDAEAP